MVLVRKGQAISAARLLTEVLRGWLLRVVAVHAVEESVDVVRLGHRGECFRIETGCVGVKRLES